MLKTAINEKEYPAAAAPAAAVPAAVVPATPVVITSRETKAGISYTQELSNFLHKNGPADIDTKFKKVRPFVFTSFVAWPLFWVYKGLEWNRNKSTYSLNAYINKVFLQAKLMQVGIIAAGIATIYIDGYNHFENNKTIKNISQAFNQANKDPREM